jgi:hypothetical protein
MSEREQPQDYVWHFKLREDDDAPGAGDEALTEMVHQQIAALLRCVQFTNDGRDVRVTGFRLLDDPSQEHRIRSALDVGSPEGE